jgi:hypothetical protein
MTQLDQFEPLTMGTRDFMAIVDRMSRGEVKENKSRFKHELLLRLRWNIFGDLGAIEVEEGLDDNGVEQRSPLSSHAIATESIAEPPVYKMDFSSGDVDELFFHQRFEKPSPITCLTSETPITIMDFVTKAHEFFNQQQHYIRKFCTPFTRTGRENGKAVRMVVCDTFTEVENAGIDPAFYFKQIWTNQDGDKAHVTLRTFVSGAFGWTEEFFWSIQRRDAVKAAEGLKEAAIFEVKYNTPDYIRQDLLFRLRWAIAGSVESIELDDGLYKDGTERRQPFLSSSLAAESLADPPVSRVAVLLEDVLQSQSFEMESDKYPYEPLTIENADGRPVTVGDFVVQLHAHFEEHRPYIYRYQETMGRMATSGLVDFESHKNVLDQGAGAQHALFFRWAFSRMCDGVLAVSVKTMIEGEEGYSNDVLWWRQRNCAEHCRDVRFKRDEALV